MSFFKYPSIQQFHGLMKYIDYARDRHPEWDSVIFDAKIKIHGTNAALVIEWTGNDLNFYTQNRSRIVTPDADNFGFSAWANEEFWPWFVEKYGDSSSYKGIKPYKLWIFGEWAGPGIQKKVAASKIDKKSLFIFDAYLWEEGDLAPQRIGIKAEEIENHDIGVYVVPVHKIYSVNLFNLSSVDSFIKEVNKDVKKIEECDPYIKSVFGIEGVGEGLVLRAVGDSYLVFKAKGEEHRVSKQSEPVQKDILKNLKVEEFIEDHVTENRVRQGISETGIDDLKGIPEVIKWTIADVEKECLAFLPEGIVWEDVRKKVGNTAAKITKYLIQNREV